MIVSDKGVEATCETASPGCEQNCTNLPSSGYVCHCFPGFNISSTDKKACVDIDECAQWGNLCPHMCLNTKGSYKCQCMEGFNDVHSDGSVCRAKGRSLLLQHQPEIRIINNVLSYPPGVHCSTYRNLVKINILPHD